MTITSWILYVLALASLFIFGMVIGRRGQVSTRAAEKYVRQGALVVDVRSSREFDAGHLSQAFNFPLDELEGRMVQRVKDKNRVILVHCRTGLRSKKAKERLARIGYTNVFVLGSYARALKIVTGRTL
jgi:phage shock protein E